MSPLRGFYCPNSGRNESFDFCFTKCTNQCKPLPVLLSLAHQDRGSDPNEYHVTEILNPPQVVYLKRNNPYYLKPDSLIDMSIGTSWHEKLEQTKKYVKELGLQNDYLMEQNFRKVFFIQVFDGKVGGTCDIVLSGTSDLYVESTSTLFDYKVMKFFYTFKYLSEGKWDDSTIPWQLNIYRLYQYRKAEHIKIFCYIKDWKLNFPERYGVNQTEMLEVPRISDRVVENKVVELLTEHVETQRTEKPRPCTDEERWFNREGIPLRCLHYCAVSEICEQFEEWKNERNNSR